MDPRRNRHFDFLAGRKPHALLGAAHGFRQRYRERSGDIRAARRRFGREVFKCAASRARAAEAAEPAAAARAMRAAGAPGEGLEVAYATEAGWPPLPRAKTFEALEARLALGVDLAAVEGLALLLVADDLIGSIKLGEARRRLRMCLLASGCSFFARRR